MRTTRPPQAENSQASTLSKPLLLRGFVVLVLLAIFAFLYRRYAMTFNTHSDFCNFLMQADAVVHENPLLSHWYLTTVSYYTTDVLYFSIGMAIRGYNPILLHEVPAVIFTIIVGLAMALAANKTDPKQCGWLAAMAVTFALIGLPDRELAFHMLTGTLHVGMMLPIFVAFLAIDVPEASRLSASPWRIVVFFVALTSAVLADTTALYIAVVPLLLVSVSEVRSDKSPASRRTLIWIAGTTLAAALAAKIAFRVIAAVGGFKMPNMYSSHASFIPFTDIGRNFGNTVESLQMIYGSDFWGLPLGKGSAFGILHLTGVAVVVYALLFAVIAWCRAAVSAPCVSNTPDTCTIDRISAVLALGMAVDLATYTFSNLQNGLETTRYLAPFAIMGSVLVGRWLICGSKYRGVLLSAVSTFGLISAVGFFFQVRQPRTSFNTPAARLGAWLRDHRMTDAYGEYWSASAVTVLSHKAALVRPIMEVGGKMAPDFCSVDERWYETPVHCLVMGTQNAENVNPKTASSDLGMPDRTYLVEGYTIFWYKKDLTPLLAKSPYAVP